MSRPGVPVGMTESEWLAARSTGIGGSDCAAVCGVSRYKTPLQVYLDKVSPPSEPREPNEAMYWGTVLEPVVASEYERRTGNTIERNPRFLRHPVYPFMVASLDGIVTDPALGLGGFEGKTGGLRSIKDWEVEGEVPDDYYFQVQHYMAVTDFAFFDVAALIGGQRFFYKRIVRDAALIDRITERESAFWNNHVLPKVPPPTTATKSDADALKAMYPGGESEPVILASEFEMLLQERSAIKDAMAGLESKVLGIENKLKAALGDHEEGRVGRYVVRWPQARRPRLDEKKLKAEHPDLADEYMTESVYRRLSVVEEVEGDGK